MGNILMGVIGDPLQWATDCSESFMIQYNGQYQDFKLGGAHLKKMRRAEGGAKIFGIFRVKKSRFYAKKSYFSNFRGGAREIFGVFRVKNHDFTPKKIIFFQF